MTENKHNGKPKREVVVLNWMPWQHMPPNEVAILVERFNIRQKNEFDGDFNEAVWDFIRDNRFNQEFIEFVYAEMGRCLSGLYWLGVERVPEDREFAIVQHEFDNQFTGDPQEGECLVVIPTDNIVNHDTLKRFMALKNEQAISDYLQRCGASVPEVKPRPHWPVKWYKPEDFAS